MDIIKINDKFIANKGAGNDNNGNQARRKRCGMAAVAAPKICKGGREREKEEKGGKKEKRGERKEKEGRKRKERERHGKRGAKKVGREGEETEKAGENMVTRGQIEM